MPRFIYIQLLPINIFQNNYYDFGKKNFQLTTPFQILSDKIKIKMYTVKKPLKWKIKSIWVNYKCLNSDFSKAQ